MKVSARLEMYLYNGIPPASAPTPRIREPRTTSKNPERQQRRHGQQEFRRILVVRVQHDDQIGAAFQRQPIAGLLVPAVPLVPFVAEHEKVVPARDLDRVVGTEVVHQYDVVDDIHRDFAQRPLERARRHCKQAARRKFSCCRSCPTVPTDFAGDYHYTTARILAKRSRSHYVHRSPMAVAVSFFRSFRQGFSIAHAMGLPVGGNPDCRGTMRITSPGSPPLRGRADEA